MIACPIGFCPYLSREWVASTIKVRPLSSPISFATSTVFDQFVEEFFIVYELTVELRERRRVDDIIFRRKNRENICKRGRSSPV